MNVFRESIFAFIILLSTTVIATPGVDLFGHKLSMEKKYPVRAMKTCQDFTGQYSGTCDDIPGQVLNLDIQQIGCDDIIIDGQWMSLDSIGVDTEVSKHYTQSFSHSLQWVSENTMLFNMLGHSFFQSEGEAFISPINVSADLTLNGNELVYSGADYTCTYYR